MAPALLLALVLAAQDKPPEKCTLSGSVVSFATGEPLNHVEILAEPQQGGAPSTTTTDSKGNFTLINLDPGEYKLRGRRNGYLSTYYGARRAEGGGTTIALEPGVEMKDIRIKLPPFAVLAGTVRETDGEPLAGARVAVYALTYWSGRRSLGQVDETHTDDLGQYRIANLPPGKYYIKAEPHQDDEDSPVVPEDHSPKTSPHEVLLPALYPGVVDPAVARPVEAAAGARITGLDITLPRSRVFHVTGHVTVPAGTVGSVNLRFMPGFEELGRGYPGFEKPNGDFEITGVPPGSYRLNASASPPRKLIAGIIDFNDRGRFSASMALEVGNADVVGVRIAINPGAEIEGHITVDGDEPAKPAGGIVQFESDTEGASGSFVGVYILENNTFSARLSQGRYDVSLGSSKDLVIKSIHSGQTDVLRDGLAVSEPGKTPLEIVLAHDGGQIEGSVLDKDDKPVAGATVLLVSESGLRGRHDRFGDVTTDQYGHYKFENAAPGDYKIFAWDDVEHGAWFDPDFFRDIESRGQAVKLDAKGHETAKVHVLEAK